MRYILNQRISREPIFRSSASEVLLRKTLISLDMKADIDAGVVDAWARVCNHKVKELGREYRTCLSVVSKVRLSVLQTLSPQVCFLKPILYVWFQPIVLGVVNLVHFQSEFVHINSMI